MEILGLNLFSIICLIVGFLLMIIEMFHPGFGVPGALGGILLILGIVLGAKSLMQALIMLIIILAILGVALTMVLRSVAKGKLSKSLILEESQNKETGYIGNQDLDYFLDQEGTALTVLRPSGTGEFKGIKLDVVSESQFIDKDKEIKIVKVEGRRIVVRELKENN